MNYGFDTGIVTDLSTVGRFGRGIRFRAAAVASSVATPGALFSNFDTYIVNGSRITHGTAPTHSSNNVTVRANISHARVIKATGTVTVQGFRFVRIPVDNFATTSCTLSLTLSVVAGGGGTIDGGTDAKTFSTNLAVLDSVAGRASVPASNLTNVNTDVSRSRYDLLTVYAATPVTLTAGTYQYSVLATDAANRSLASLWKSQIPIPTNTTLYPDPDDASNATSYTVLEILSSV